LRLGRIIPVGHDASGPTAINFALEYPESVSSLCLLNSFYAAGASVKIPELIGLFATPGLQALSAAVMENPEQFAWLLKFQQGVFQDALPESHRAHFAATLPRIINDNFGPGKNSAVAFTRMRIFCGTSAISNS
jgi:haloalkane dehalogenase